MASKQAFLKAMGKDIRELRLEAGISQDDIAGLFEWGRDAVSKLERGTTSIGVYEYLQIIEFLREMQPDHPALNLSKYLNRRARSA